MGKDRVGYPQGFKPRVSQGCRSAAGCKSSKPTGSNIVSVEVPTVMSQETKFAGLDGSTVGVDSAAVEALRRAVHGTVLGPKDTGYRESRTIWNRMIDRKPALIVQAVDTHDVVKAVAFASERGLLLSVRAGGHNHLGFAVCEGGLMIDLTRMKNGSVDPEAGIATVGAGLTFADFDALCHRVGMAATGAVVSMVGLPGYLLGGGIGWLHRKAGAGCDNIVAAELVTAEGRVIEVDESRNPDLLWALRGGGGNFGVVTRFGLRLHRVKDVYAGLIFHALEDMPRVAKFVDEFMENAPKDLNVWMLHRRAPYSPFLPTSLRGRLVIALAVTYAGPLDAADVVVGPLQRFLPPLLDLMQVRPYPEWQRTFDGIWGEGYHNEWVGHYLDTYDADAISTIQRFVSEVPSPHTDVKLARLGGAFSETGEYDTAFGFRRSRYALVIQSRWEDPSETEKQLHWTRQFHAAMKEYSTGKVYTNFIGQEPAERVADAYSTRTYARLRELKKQYDPENLFRMNINIKPA